MSNLKKIEAFFAAYAQKNVAAIREVMADDITWFIPGHTLETFPEECAMVRDAGHEIGTNTEV